MTKKSKLIADIIILSLSIALAAILAKTGYLNGLMYKSLGFKFIGNFIAGAFFTFILTAAPATVALGELSQDTPLFLVAVIGAFGSLAGDYLIFHFIRSALSEEASEVLDKKFNKKRFLDFFRHRRVSWLALILGAIIVASPLPDEVGLTLMGVSHISTRWLLLLSFWLNFFGILVIGLIARSLV